MIREFQSGDLDRVMELWLNSNTDAHDFINSSYWQENYQMVRELLPESELYVYEKEDMICGFIGLTGDYIAGIFVDISNRSEGIGRQLLDHAKEMHSKLSLQVYKKNSGAVGFYKKHGFSLEAEGFDDETGETELIMIWTE